MTRHLRIRIIVLACLLQLWAGAQKPLPNGSNLQQKWVAVKQHSILLDTVSIVPGTDSIMGISKKTYQIDWAKSQLTWLAIPASDSVLITYRVFPFRFYSTTQRLSWDSIAGQTVIAPATLQQNGASKSLFSFGNLQYSGSFGRGISFGNNQDAVVQSAFNLQLNGFLGDSIQVAAAITDNNLPIQPDGTTQQLNEFDQVFLQFKKKNWQLNLGDLDLRQNDLYFLNFYKRLQGAAFKTSYQLSPSVKSTILASGSIAKGKFTRNVFQGLEGNQGPYRLSGTNGEAFFIVLANTERVFIDGELLQRGEDQDYIINYNTAELTFMPRRMITRDSRIQVEFEYADRNYLNANLYAAQAFDVGHKLKVRIAAYTNSDARSSPINQPLTGPQRMFLSNLGDDVQQALYPAVLRDTFGVDKVLYELVVDSTQNGIDSFYRYTTNPATARYALSFTDLGAGNGNYVVSRNVANGKVFEYIGPQAGAKQGRYEPVAYLVTPKKQQLISASLEYAPDKLNKMTTEVALSNYDVNTFSDKSNGDNKGFAARMQYNNVTAISKTWQLQSGVHAEHVQARFKPLERLRAVEFSREWGLPLLLSQTDETIVKGGTQLRNATGDGIGYEATSYHRGDGYRGFQNSVQQSLKRGGLNTQSSFLHTRFNTATTDGSYLRPAVDVQQRLKGLGDAVLKLAYVQERAEVRYLQGDSLQPLSYAFHVYTAGLQTSESSKNRYALNFFTRANRYPVVQSLVKGDRSYNLNLQADVISNPAHQLFVNATWRQLKVLHKTAVNADDENTFLGRAEYRVQEWKGAITGNVLFEIGTGQEQRRDITYIEVPAGQGTFAWVDYNNDGVQQLSEFETALFRDQARFIRIFVPTNDFIKAHFTTLNYSFVVSPKNIWTGNGLSGLQQLLNRFQLQSTMQTAKKSIAALDRGITPLKYNLQDTALISLNTSFVNTLSFNRYASVWGLELSQFVTTAKALLTYGYESRRASDWTVRLRWMWSSSISFDLVGKKGTTELYTPSFDNRNYAINIRSVEPRINLIRDTRFRLQGSYVWEQKLNAAKWGGQQALSHALNLETKYNVLQNSSIAARIAWTNIDFNDKTSSPLAYIMLNALLPGQNYLWTIDLTKRLLNGVELNFQYDGRKPAGTNTIHTGRASLRALF